MITVLTRFDCDKCGLVSLVPGLPKDARDHPKVAGWTFTDRDLCFSCTEADE